jgi:hypothetical protein
MMASTRTLARIVSAAVLSLALLAGSASAECAWVLWQLDTRPIAQEPGWRQKFYTAVEAFPKEAKRHPSGREMAAELCAGIRLYREKLEKESREYVCLPDTIDPRGPKSR